MLISLELGHTVFKAQLKCFVFFKASENLASNPYCFSITLNNHNEISDIKFKGRKKASLRIIY